MCKTTNKMSNVFQLSAAQASKHRNGKPFQLSAEQLRGGAPASKGKIHNVELNVSKQMESAARRGKGMRIQGAGLYNSGLKKAGWGSGFEGEGSKKKGSKFLSALGKATGTALDVANQTGLTSAAIDYGLSNSNLSEKQKKAASNIGNVGSHLAANQLNGRGLGKLVKKAGKSLKNASKQVQQIGYDLKLGKVVESAKAVIPQDVAEGVIQAGLIASGTDPSAASSMASAAAATLYGYQFDEPPTAENAASAVTQGAVAGATSYISGSGVQEIGVPRGVGNFVRLQATKPEVVRGKGFQPIGSGAVRSTVMRNDDPNIQYGHGFKPVGGSFKPIQGNGGAPKRFAKGSQEAKDHMARLRAMRGRK
jgi:hypothetical protein